MRPTTYLGGPQRFLPHVTTPTNFCTICAVPICNPVVHRRWHDTEDQRFGQLVAALNAAVSGVNRLAGKVDRIRREDAARQEASAPARR